MTAEPQFLFVITAHNVRPFAGALVASLAFQRYPHWRAIFCDDASTDGTPAAVRSLLESHRLESKFQIIEHRQRRYKARNVFEILGEPAADKGEVVVMLDGDDHLAADHALERLAREYRQGWEVVWSNWRGTDGRPGTSGHLHPFVSPRRQRFVSGHLFSFRRSLCAALAEHDFQDDRGHWLQAACDVALALPILDQTIKRKHIEEVLLIYNRANPLSHAAAPRDSAAAPQALRATQAQSATLRLLCRRGPKPLTIDNDFLHAHLYELLQAAAISVFAATQRQIAQALRARPRPAKRPRA